MNCFPGSRLSVESRYRHDDTTELPLGQITLTADFHAERSRIPHLTAHPISTRLPDFAYTSTPVPLLPPSVPQSRSTSVFPGLNPHLEILWRQVPHKELTPRRRSEVSSEENYPQPIETGRMPPEGQSSPGAVATL